MIRTITLNPAVDKTVEIDNFKVGNVNRVSTQRVDAGGKGINVSKVIKSLGGESKALGVLAGRNGQFIKSYLDSIEIDNKFVFVNGETRTNLKVIDKINGTNTDINETGTFVSEEDLRKVELSIFEDLSQGLIVIFSGSVPQGIPKNIYGKWINKAKGLGIKTILDADGELLKEGIEAGPYMIKPNIHELEKLFNKKLESTEAVIEAAKCLFNYGINEVVVSLGGDGALFINKKETILAHGLNVQVKSTVGAGDSMVAALAYSMEKGYKLEETVILSVATSAANVMTSGTQPADINEISRLMKDVKFEYIK
ncbi:1-phosphofructokinase [Clostridium sp. YIM B02515]|uniref:Tagatose-6-phosphate kinase n=1 Tax=Clostridium rhizosphaerae TaxID=2803861 RepID=A0ABS1T8V5_9CLOT|nr:1-phosphofructokinase [Clostridium rhizosphaerae]MBL4934448.1 1-phosphofructokinase [Clostridium rhizosphaerae]